MNNKRGFEVFEFEYVTILDNEAEKLDGRLVAELVHDGQVEVVNECDDALVARRAKQVGALLHHFRHEHREELGRGGLRAELDVVAQHACINTRQGTNKMMKMMKG